LSGNGRRIPIGYLLDTWAWIEYFSGNRKTRRYILGDEPLITSVVTITEIVRYCRKTGNTDLMGSMIQEIGLRSDIVPVSQDIAFRAGEHYNHDVDGIADSLILATARDTRYQYRIVTGDPHFRKLPETVFIG